MCFNLKMLLCFRLINLWYGFCNVKLFSNACVILYMNFYILLFINWTVNVREKDRLIYKMSAANYNFLLTVWELGMRDIQTVT